MSTPKHPAAPRSWLFVPGDRPERFARALSSGADAVIFDLEDAVAPERRALAVEHVRDILQQMPGQAPLCTAWVRTPGTATHADTPALLQILGRCPGLTGWVVPKVEAASDLQGWTHPVMAQIETPRALESLSTMLDAAAPHLWALALGPEDLSAELCAPPTEALLTPLASRVIVAARARAMHVYACPGTLTEFKDLAAWKHTLRAGRALGSDGALCIHPAQIDGVHSVFDASPTERTWAQKVMQAWEARQGAGAVAVEGRMVDRPVMLRAERILARAAVTQTTERVQ